MDTMYRCSMPRHNSTHPNSFLRRRYWWTVTHTSRVYVAETLDLFRSAQLKRPRKPLASYAEMETSPIDIGPTTQARPRERELSVSSRSRWCQKKPGKRRAKYRNLRLISDERKERDFSGEFDRRCKGALMSSAGSGLAARLDLSSFRGESAQLHRILKVDVDCLVDAECADFSSRSFEASLSSRSISPSGSSLV